MAVKKSLSQEIKSRQKENRAAEKQVKSLVASDPKLFKKVVSGIDPKSLSDADYQEISIALQDLANLLTGADSGTRGAIRDVVKKLPRQGKKALNELSDLMETLTLGQITAVTTEVTRRLSLLQTFRERVLDDKTYEIRGDGSIHRFLERAMWIVDDKYWLMNSNEELRKIVTKKLDSSLKKHEKKRPDFVCGTVDNALIIMELKRPSHKLDVEDLNQLERYLSIIENHTTSHSSYRGILVGREYTRELKDRVKYRKGFSIKTFSDLISGAEKRYRTYLRSVSG